MPYALVVEIREGPRLVLTHIFHGATREAARGVFQAHMKYDSFLRACVESQVFRGRVPCVAEMHWQTGSVLTLETS